MTHKHGSKETDGSNNDPEPVEGHVPITLDPSVLNPFVYTRIDREGESSL